MNRPVRSPSKDAVHRAAVFTGLAACYLLGCAPLGASSLRAEPKAATPGTLRVGAEVTGSTTKPDRLFAAICTGGGIAGRFSSNTWEMVAPETATYRFEVRAAYAAVLQIDNPSTPIRWGGPITCVGGSRDIDLLVTLRASEAYAVVIDGKMQERGDYRLKVSIDTSPQARIRPEDRSISSALLAHSASIREGRTFGAFQSLAGGIRAPCGGLGTAIVYRVEIDAERPELEVHAAGQFRTAVEVRDGAGTSLGCARASEGEFEAGLTVRLSKGTYFIVLDTVELSPSLFKNLPYSEAPGPGVRGSYVLDLKLSR